jgi:hypothetical protein
MLVPAASDVPAIDAVRQPDRCPHDRHDGGSPTFGDYHFWADDGEAGGSFLPWRRHASCSVDIGSW